MARPAPGTARRSAGKASLQLYNRGRDWSRPTGGRTMDGTSSSRIDKSVLTKGQRRKLNALRKSVGEEIGEQAFAAWLASQGAAQGKADANAALILDTLWPLVEGGTLAIPRGGYLIRRGRGRMIVEPARS